MKLRKKVVSLFTASLLVIGVLLTQAKTVYAADVVVYKSPTCGCCKKWVSHLEENGFDVEVHDQQNISPIKDELGVPKQVRSCHTAKIGNYVVEGHVPADLIKKMLKEKPDIVGLSVPGMVMGSPGMEGPRKDPYRVISFNKDNEFTVYANR